MPPILEPFYADFSGGSKKPSWPNSFQKGIFISFKSPNPAFVIQKTCGQIGSTSCRLTKVFSHSCSSESKASALKNGQKICILSIQPGSPVVGIWTPTRKFGMENDLNEDECFHFTKSRILPPFFPTTKTWLIRHHFSARRSSKCCGIWIQSKVESYQTRPSWMSSLILRYNEDVADFNRFSGQGHFFVAPLLQCGDVDIVAPEAQNNSAKSSWFCFVLICCQNGIRVETMERTRPIERTKREKT